MKWYVKCGFDHDLTSIHTTAKEAIETLRSKCRKGYYLDVKFEDTEEFVNWMNRHFLDPHDHGKCCKIYRTDSDSYWTSYLKSLGADIMYALVEGIESGTFDHYHTYVQYLEGDSRFISFDTMDEFFANVYPLKDILEELTYRY